MAGSCIVAIESRKQAARRPSPPFPNPASGSCSMRPSQSRLFCGGDFLREGIEQKIGDIVGERPPDQKLHRQIVDPLRVLPVIGALGQNPTLRQHIPHRTRGGLEALAWPGSFRSDDVVEEQVPLVKASLWPENRIGPQPYCSRRLDASRCACVDRGERSSVNSFMPTVPLVCRRRDRVTSGHGSVSFHSSIAGSAGLCCSWPSTLRLAVSSTRCRPHPASRPT